MVDKCPVCRRPMDESHVQSWKRILKWPGIFEPLAVIGVVFLGTVFAIPAFVLAIMRDDGLMVIALIVALFAVAWFWVAIIDAILKARKGGMT
jgi:hypothetical protein